MMESIAVLLSTFNGEKYVEEQIESILSQSNIIPHIYIRDDGSTDGTLGILRSIQQKHPDNIVIMEGCNIGWRKSFIELLDKVEGYKLYSFSDQDDIWLEDKASVAVNKIKDFEKNSSGAVLYISNVWVVDEKLERIREHCSPNRNMMERPLNQVILSPSMPGGLSYVFNSAVRANILKMKSFYRYGHDALAYQTSLALGKVIYDATPYVLYRQHGSNVCGASSKRLAALRHSVSIALHGNSESVVTLLGGILKMFSEKEFHKDWYFFAKDLQGIEHSLRNRIVFIRKYNVRRNTWKETFSLCLKILLGRL